MRFRLSVFAALSLAVFLVAPALSAAPPSAAPLATATRPATPATPSVATFAMGCFWCAEATFEGREGVLSVTSGYTGGTRLNPTYQEVVTGLTGHFESINILFDPKKTTYAKLLDIFWHNVDPTQGDGQFCDRGSEYRSVIFYHGETQKQQALETRKQIEASARLKKPIVTLIVPAAVFYPAEDYHQDFYRKDPMQYHQYREGCGRDARLKQLWGRLDAYASGH